MNGDINHVLILGCGQTGLSIGRYLINDFKISFYDENKSALDKAKKLFDNEKNLFFSGDLEESFFKEIDFVND